MKTLKKVILYLLASAGIILIALIASVFLFKDKIINEFIREANKQLNTPVRVSKFDVSVFEAFPNLSIVLNDVYVEDSHQGLYPLLTAKKVTFQLNPLNAIRGDYSISGLSITGSETNLKINAKGENNYTILKKTAGGQRSSVKFSLRNVSLDNTTVHYLDLAARQNMEFSSSNMIASIESADDIYTINARGVLTTHQIEVDGMSYFREKSFVIDSDLVYDDLARHLTIQPSNLSLHQAMFAVSGTYEWKHKNLINITVDGKNTDIQTLLSLLPSSHAEKFQKYGSRGDVYFHAGLKGEITRNRKPGVSVEFGFENLTIFHPESKATITGAKLRGSFASSDLSNPRLSSLVLKDISGALNNQSFQADFVLNDMVDPEVICKFRGKVEAPALLAFYPLDDVKDVSGSLFAEVGFEGKIALLKDKATAQRVTTQGTIDLHDINFTYGKEQVPVSRLNGSLQFNNNDLALSNVSGQFGNSDFLLNGFFKNIITFLLFENQPIGIETDLKSARLDVDQLFLLAYGRPSATDEEYTFSISRNVYLNFNCDVGVLNYKRFRARSLHGDLLVKNEVAVSRNLSFESMGGTITMSGIVDARNHKAIDVVSTVRLDGVNVDSAFYVFENFQQNFIEDRHLKGRATAEVNMEMTLNQHLRLFPETLIADIGITIRNGELNNFEPIRKLERYVDDQGLDKLRFSDLRNDIHIENSTVYIPQMDVRSNVTDLKISGTHTFAQAIDYRIVTPLRKRRIIDVDAEGAIENSMDGQSKLFLKITGTTDNYRVAYDTEAVRKKIAGDFKKEVQELKDAFKRKGKKKEKELELEKDEYFDW